jgi:hypothetical protein
MVFCAGTHTDCIRMHYGDFADVAQPVVGTFSSPRRESESAADRSIRDLPAAGV